MKAKIETQDNLTAKYSISFEGLTEEEVFALKKALLKASADSTRAEKLLNALDKAAMKDGFVL